MYFNDYSQLTKRVQQSLAAITEQWANQFSTTALINKYLSEQLSALNLANFRINVPDIYIGLSNLDLEQLTGAADLAKQIDHLISISAFNQIQDLVSGYDLITRRIAADFSVFQKISEQLTNTFSDIFAPIAETSEVIDAFHVAGWPIAPSMDKEFKKHVASLHKEGKTRYISRAIIGYYHKDGFKNLEKAVDNWSINPLFTPRMHIFRAALKAHKEGDYVLSVPALLPQVEGVLNEYVKETGLSARAGKIREVYEAVLDDVDAPGLTTWSIVNSLLYFFQNNIYASTSFDAELRRSITNRSVTRHTVLHGIAPNYDRPVHSLRIFLLLDALSLLRPDDDVCPD